MKYEKSCGAVIMRNNGGETECLLVLNKKFGAKEPHWGFPKGHVEGTENEYETAAREILEEVGMSVVFHGNARVVSTYSPRTGVTKDAVYFLAIPKNGQEVTLQQSEISKYRWCSLKTARELLSYDVKVLDKLEKFL